MYKKTLILLLIVYYLLFLSAPISALAHGGAHDDLIIRMTKDGFEPSEMTITQGDEVLFINNGGEDHWPASNFHPQHTLYPEFDSLKGVKPGESWKFKFEKVGIWRMHDHLFPHNTGTITVLADESATTSQGQTLSIDSQGLTLWSRIKNWFSKFFKPKPTAVTYAQIEKMAEGKGAKATWEYVKSIYNTPSGVVGSPHDMAHLVGQLIYKEQGLAGLSICDSSFAFGCYHGLMEVAFDKYKDKPNDVEYKKGLLEARDGCKAVGPEASGPYVSCIHGMGHGIITFREHDLNKALSDCDTLEVGARTYCDDGIFMELSISAPSNFYKQADPIYPCDAVADNYKTACARSQVSVMRNRFHLDTQAISNACNATKNEKISYHCTEALGFYMAQSNSENPEKVVSGCEEILNGDAQAQCKAAAAGELVFQNIRGWHDSVLTICESMNANYKTNCEARVTQVKKSYGRN
jgi:plastocyanin